MVSSVIWSDKDILLFMRVLFFMGIMVSFLGILQHVGVINLRYDPTIPQNSRHVTSTLSFNYAHLGVFQLVISLFTLSLFHEAKNILSKLFYSSALMLFLYVLFLSGSRAAFLGTVVALCIFFIYSDQKKYLLGMMSVGLLTIFVIGLPEYIVNRLGGGFGAGETGIGRMNSWKNFPDYFNASEFFNVLFGVGFMRFKFSAISYFHSTAGHNNFLNAYVETGIFGFFSFCYVIFSIFQKARRRLKDFVSGESRYFRIGYFASFIGLAVTCVSMETFSVVLAFTSFLGFFMFITGVFVGKRQ
jgi:O-antigen ligase